MNLPGKLLGQLQSAIVAAFTANELSRLVRIYLGQRLANAVDVHNDLLTIVFDLLEWIDRRPDKWPPFLDGLLEQNKHPDLVSAVEQARRYLNLHQPTNVASAVDVGRQHLPPQPTTAPAPTPPAAPVAPPATAEPQRPRRTGGYSDVTYVVFCRLEGIKEMPADLLGATAEALAAVVREACGRNAEMESHSSVYGRLVIVPRRAQEALDVAKELHEKTAAAGVRLAIGIAGGRVEQTQDLTQHNVAGAVVNRAARLAHLEGGVSLIAVDEATFKEGTQGSSRYPAKDFGELQQGRVKRTELRYYWLNYRAPALAPPPVPQCHHEAETAHIVAYDIVRFSEKEFRDLVQVVEDLNHAVRRALQAAGGDRLEEGRDCWYAPAGDGGVLVFRADKGGGSRAAWSFTQALLNHTHERIPLRVGLTSGPIVVLEGDLPVGSGILLADHLSGMAEEGAACVSRRFWENALEKVDTAGWRAQPVSDDNDALAVRSDSSDSGSSPGITDQGPSPTRPGGVPKKSKNQPPAPPPVRHPDDPQKNRWGGLSERDGRKLTARFGEIRKKFFYLDLVVESTDGTKLEGPVVFYLHDSYPKSVVQIRKIRTDNTAVLEEVTTYGDYTAAAQVRNAQGEWVGLELDLSGEKNFPKDFLGD